MRVWVGCVWGGVLEAVLLRDGYRFLSKWWLVGVSRRLLMSLAKLVLKPQCFVYLFIVSRIVYAAVVGDVFFFFSHHFFFSLNFVLLLFIQSSKTCFIFDVPDMRVNRREELDSFFLHEPNLFLCLRSVFNYVLQYSLGNGLLFASVSGTPHDLLPGPSWQTRFKICVGEMVSDAALRAWLAVEMGKGG